MRCSVCPSRESGPSAGYCHSLRGTSHCSHARSRGRGSPTSCGQPGPAGQLNYLLNCRASNLQFRFYTGMLIRFDDRTVIVTGAAHGFGRTIALNFATLGANVVACDVVKNGLEETARLATEQGTPLRICALDVSDAPSVHNLVAETQKA